MTIDREALANDLIPHLTATGHLVALAKVPDGGGGDPAGTFVPYAILYPQPTVPRGMLAGAHVGDVTVMQLTAVATDPDIALRVAHDLETLALAVTGQLASRNVVQVRVVLSGGPTRDPDDQRLWFAFTQPSIETHS